LESAIHLTATAFLSNLTTSSTKGVKGGGSEIGHRVFLSETTHHKILHIKQHTTNSQITQLIG